MNSSLPGLTIPKSKRKYYICLLLSLCGLIALFVFFRKTNSFSSNSGLVLFLVFYILIHYLILVPICMWRLFSSKPDLVINSLGIHCRRGAKLPNQLVRWEFFESYSFQKYYERDFIELRLKDKVTFLKKFSSYQRGVKLGFGAALFPLGLFPNKIRIDKKKLIDHLNQWLPFQEPDLGLDLDQDLGDDVKE